MRLADVGFGLRLILFCVCIQALGQEQRTTVTGTLTRMMAIGGETTSWAIQLDSVTSINGKPVDTLEVDLRDRGKLERLNNQRVRATGKLSRRTGVETGVRSVLEISFLEEAAVPSNAGRNLTGLFRHIWQITEAPLRPASGSIYVFLPNGSLLQTSCVETYRIARWSTDKSSPSVLRVVEDGQLAFTASITDLTDRTLKLRRKLARGNETQDITLRAVEREFVCPDLPK